MGSARALPGEEVQARPPPEPVPAPGRGRLERASAHCAAARSGGLRAPAAPGPDWGPRLPEPMGAPRKPGPPVAPPAAAGPRPEGGRSASGSRRSAAPAERSVPWPPGWVPAMVRAGAASGGTHHRHVFRPEPRPWPRAASAVRPPAPRPAGDAPVAGPSPPATRPAAPVPQQRRCAGVGCGGHRASNARSRTQPGFARGRGVRGIRTATGWRRPNDGARPSRTVAMAGRREAAERRLS
jgi:hypothetical protein